MWMKFRHKVVFFILRWPMFILFKIKYNLKVTRFKINKQPYLILSNHCCTMDPFFIGIMTNRPVYFMASQDLFNKGFTSKLIRFLVNPIPKSKSVRDLQAIKDCLRVRKEGGTICIFPEGNRTYSGGLCYIEKSISKLARKLNMPVLIVNVKGGFQSDPRFSDFVRKGRVSVEVAKELSVEEIKNLSDEELYNVIVKYINPGLITDVEFKSSKKAMYLERVMYYCFECNTFQSYHSNKNVVSCTNCHDEYTYTSTCQLKPVKKEEKPIYLDDYYKRLTSFVKSHTLNDIENLEFNDFDVRLFSIKLRQKRRPIYLGNIKLINNMIVLGDYIFKFDDIKSITCVGKNKLNIYLDDKTFQVKGSRMFCALKYVHFIYHYKHLKSGGVLNDINEYLGI